MTAVRDRHSHREPLMKTSEVARQCRVTSETVIAWMNAGRLRGLRTPGGQYRFDSAEVDALMEEISNEARACCVGASDQDSGGDVLADMACERAV